MDLFHRHETMAATAVSLGVLNTGKTDLDTSGIVGGAAWIGATTVSSARPRDDPACISVHASSTGNAGAESDDRPGTPVAARSHHRRRAGPLGAVTVPIRQLGCGFGRSPV